MRTRGTSPSGGGLRRRHRALAVTAAGCSGSKPAADKCQSVSAPLTDIPTRTDQEPKMRIPVPPGWERSTKMDSEQIRFSIRQPGT